MKSPLPASKTDVEVSADVVVVGMGMAGITASMSALDAGAKVVAVEIESNEPKVCKVSVPESQLSLAIGNKGQNVRLAAKLTGWKIDIHPESGFFGE